jgi:hypothetical protein
VHASAAESSEENLGALGFPVAEEPAMSKFVVGQIAEAGTLLHAPHVRTMGQD